MPKVLKDNPIYINCPYTEKDYAKTYGAKWDPIKKSWYLTNKYQLNYIPKRWIIIKKYSPRVFIKHRIFTVLTPEQWFNKHGMYGPEYGSCYTGD